MRDFIQIIGLAILTVFSIYLLIRQDLKRPEKPCESYRNTDVRYLPARCVNFDFKH